MITLKINSSWLLTLIVAAFVAITVLLNQRQELAIYPALAIQFFAIVLTADLLKSEQRTGFSTSKILFAIFLLSLISNLSYLGSEIRSPLEHWARLLVPILLIPLSTYLTTRSSSNIKVFTGIFTSVALLAAYQVHTVSELLVRLNTGTLQTNWGNALAAVSPFLFLIRSKFFKNALLFIVILTLIISLKRTALLSAGILIFAALLSSSSTIARMRRMTKRGAGTFIIILIGMIASFTKASQNENLIRSYEYAIERLRNSASDGGSGRIDVWAEAVSIMSDAGFWQNTFGHGFGWFNDNTYRLGFTVESLHNDLLDFWISFGPFGVIMYLILMGRLGYLAISTAGKSSDHASFAISAVLIFYVYSLFAGIFFYYMFFLPLFVAIGYLEAVRTSYLKSSF